MDREVVQGVGQTNQTDTYQRGEQKKNEEKSYEKKNEKKNRAGKQEWQEERIGKNERFKRRS